MESRDGAVLFYSPQNKISTVHHEKYLRDQCSHRLPQGLLRATILVSTPSKLGVQG